MADHNFDRLVRPKRLAAIRGTLNSQSYAKQEVRKKLNKVKGILKKHESERTDDEIVMLHQLKDVVKTAKKNEKQQKARKERILEIEDDPATLSNKCEKLADMISSAKYAIVYTGAGISTAASIPDYRGPNGVWTLLKKGQALRSQDLVDAEPTFTHMCITKLFKEHKVKYLVSQNCDGLHIRSGFPRHSLSEIHGNMFIEICKNCKSQKEFIRLFDVTERTAKNRHKTGRTCNKCGGNLYDSIVHFGEKGGYTSPYKWKQAAKAASKSDLVVCLGSSLKVLRCYPCLWGMNFRPEQRPNLVIVNLQWTPKDEHCCLKIHGRCDDVLRKVAQHLQVNVPNYSRMMDALLRLHTPVKNEEKHVNSKQLLDTCNWGQPSLTHNNGKASDIEISAASRHDNMVTHLPVSVKRALNDQIRTAQQTSLSLGVTEAIRDEHMAFHLSAVRQKSAHDYFSKLSSQPEQSELEGRLQKQCTDCSRIDLASSSLVSTLRLCCQSASSNLKRATVSCTKFQNFSSGKQTLFSISKLSCFNPQLQYLLSTRPTQHPTRLTTSTQNVFRVDLSTNPVRITNLHASAVQPNARTTSVNLDNLLGHRSSPTPIPVCSCCSFTESISSTIAKINFFHSYARNCISPHKITQKQIKITPTSTAVLLQQGRECPNGQFMCTDAFNSNRMKEKINIVLGHPWTLHVATPQITVNHHSNDVCLELPRSPCKHFENGIVPPVRLYQLLHTPAKHFISSTLVSAPRCEQPAPLPVQVCDTPTHRSDGNCTEVDCLESECVTNTAHKEAPSVPGWFGKGLRVKRKRT